jgi:uncharacterized protein (TIGR02391 family)
MAEPPLPEAQLRGLCYALGDTSLGLSGSEISQLLAECRIEDVAPGMAKRDRLFGALHQQQSLDKSSNNVLAFIQAALSPARYTRREEFYENLRRASNKVLSFAGYFVQDDGKIRRMAPSRTIREAVEKAGALMSELTRRQIHAAVIKDARSDILQEDYARAVLEATKGMAEALREKVHSKADGSDLVDYALSGNANRRPRFAMNPLESETDWSEHHGLASLLKGVFSLLRNPPSHKPRSKYSISDIDALDSLSLISMLHRRIEQLVSTEPPRTS